MRGGVNVVIWFATNLASKDGEPAVTGGPNYTCVAAVAAALEADGLPTTHLEGLHSWVNDGKKIWGL